MHPRPWFILGAGSIGCLFAAYLRRAGHSVTLILRDGNAVEDFRRAGGIQLNRADEDPSVINCEAISLDMKGYGTSSAVAPIERVLVCTKAHQTRDAIIELIPALGEPPLLVFLQNGMGVRELIQPLLPQATIAQAITTEGVWRRGRFEVVHAGHGETRVGAVNTEAPNASQIAAALRCELDIHADPALETRLWTKLAVNCAINPLSALRGCRNGELLHHPDIQFQVKTLCTELWAVARACGQSLELEALENATFDVMRRTANNQSSMWQDLQNRRRTEIDFISGYVVRQGARHQVACPAHAALWQAIKQKEAELNCS